ncbi:hypothetical protein BSKO_00597 [Bryopsis sp. KO-2023]|nr:hypothetical protein BSKO_00597 [Bryopsis sp. KO-2023]
MLQLVKLGARGVLVVLLASLHFCEALIDLAPGSASINIPFFNVGFSVCHQSQVCGVNGVTYQSPCDAAHERVEVRCKRPCPCQKPKKRRQQRELPTDIWFAEPTALVISAPPPEIVVTVPETPSHNSQEIVHGLDQCSQRPDPGTCDPEEYLLRYYFDSRRNGCTPFLYSGCDGNSNRFASRAECKVVCENGGNRKLRLR